MEVERQVGESVANPMVDEPGQHVYPLDKNCQKSKPGIFIVNTCGQGWRLPLEPHRAGLCSNHIRFCFDSTALHLKAYFPMNHSFSYDGLNHSTPFSSIYNRHRKTVTCKEFDELLLELSTSISDLKKSSQPRLEHEQHDGHYQPGFIKGYPPVN